MFSVKTLLGASAIATIAALPEDEKFSSLPGFDSGMPSDSYSGYLRVSDTKQLHYVFVESQGDKDSDPILVWLNGGPGCSSMLGFFTEHGPLLTDGTTFKANDDAWNKRANVLYIESPAGVGFSTTSDGEWDTNDTLSAEDLYAALANWFSKFDSFANGKELYISGESYGGVYVPYLAYEVYKNNNVYTVQGDTDKIINLKGFLVGNGATHWDYDVSPSYPQTLYGFNMISKQLFDAFNEKGCEYYFNDFRPHKGPDECDDLWKQINDAAADMWWYDMYRPDPQGKLPSEVDREGKVTIDGKEKTYKRGFTPREYTPWLAKMNPDNKHLDRVMYDTLADYVNSAETRSALHIPNEVQGWSPCSDQLQYHLQEEASYWIYPIMKANDIRMIFFSGDADGAVNTYGSKRWIRDLDWDVKNGWRSWKKVEDDTQVAGYIVNYDGMDFATVKGVGHMAPTYAPADMQKLVLNWIHNEDI